MSLEKILSKVEADSRAAELAIIREAEDARAEQLRQASERCAEVLRDFDRRAAQAIAQLRSREEAGLEMEVKKHMLASRRRALESAFEGVLDHFRKLPAPAKKELYAALMAMARKDIPGGRIRHARGEEALFAGITGFAKGDPFEGAGGFILSSADGRMEMDMRFEVLLRELWDRNLGEISARLFGGDGP